tara:strand:+ start:1302 stop:1964 length:663 start_codon:yes stop_codon:yes gene_type:complete
MNQTTSHQDNRPVTRRAIFMEHIHDDKTRVSISMFEFKKIKKMINFILQNFYNNNDQIQESLNFIKLFVANILNINPVVANMMGITLPSELGINKNNTRGDFSIVVVFGTITSNKLSAKYCCTLQIYNTQLYISKIQKLSTICMVNALSSRYSNTFMEESKKIESTNIEKILDCCCQQNTMEKVIIPIVERMDTDFLKENIEFEEISIPNVTRQLANQNL